MIQSDLQQTRLGYLKGVLSERWPAPSRIPTLLAVSPDSDATAVTFGRLGFRVEEISADDPLENLRQQLPLRIAAFDVICCWDLLEHREDWRDIMGLMARALRTGGVLFYSVSGRRKGIRRDLAAILRRGGLLPQPVAGIDHGVPPRSTGRTMRDRRPSYLGFALRRRDRATGLVPWSRTPTGL